jgi:hypothetical protein
VGVFGTRIVGVQVVSGIAQQEASVTVFQCTAASPARPRYSYQNNGERKDPGPQPMICFGPEESMNGPPPLEISTGSMWKITLPDALGRLGFGAQQSRSARL